MFRIIVRIRPEKHTYPTLVDSRQRSKCPNTRKSQNTLQLSEWDVSHGKRKNDVLGV